MSPKWNRQRTTTVVLAAGGRSFNLSLLLAQMLPHAAGMWNRRGDRHGHWGEHAHQQQNQQQSGGQTTHKTWRQIHAAAPTLEKG